MNTQAHRCAHIHSIAYCIQSRSVMTDQWFKVHETSKVFLTLPMYARVPKAIPNIDSGKTSLLQSTQQGWWMTNQPVGIIWPARRFPPSPQLSWTDLYCCFYIQCWSMPCISLAFPEFPMTQLIIEIPGQCNNILRSFRAGGLRRDLDALLEDELLF